MRTSYLIGAVSGCGLCAIVIALNSSGGLARAEQIGPATTTGSTSSTSRPTSLEYRVESLERAIAREQPQSSLAERLRQLERRIGGFERSLAKEPQPAELDPERLRRSVEALERSTRAIETRLALLERARRDSTFETKTPDLFELERTIDRIVARVDDLDLRLRRLERVTEW